MPPHPGVRVKDPERIRNKTMHEAENKAADGTSIFQDVVRSVERVLYVGSLSVSTPQCLGKSSKSYRTRELVLRVPKGTRCGKARVEKRWRGNPFAYRYIQSRFGPYDPCNLESGHFTWALVGRGLLCPRVFYPEASSSSNAPGATID